MSSARAIGAWMVVVSAAACSPPVPATHLAPAHPRVSPPPAAPCVRVFEIAPDAFTISDVGGGQGLARNGDRLWVYGDASTGVMKELMLRGTQVVPTGRQVVLTEQGVDVIPHPTGVVFDDSFGALIGNTRNGQGTLRFVDFVRLTEQGTLDDAIVHTVVDDAAQNGTRPERVLLDGEAFIASSDYGDDGNAVRLYRPDALRSAATTSADGVLAHAFSCGPFVQSLHHLKDTAELLLIQNVSYGVGWRLTLVDFHASVAAGVAVVVLEQTFELPDELEGAVLLPDGRFLFLTSSEQDNARFGTLGCAP